MSQEKDNSNGYEIKMRTKQYDSNKKDVIISSNKTESNDEEADATEDENSQIINKPYSRKVE